MVKICQSTKKVGPMFGAWGWVGVSKQITVLLFQYGQKRLPDYPRISRMLRQEQCLWKAWYCRTVIPNYCGTSRAATISNSRSMTKWANYYTPSCTSSPRNFPKRAFLKICYPLVNISSNFATQAGISPHESIIPFAPRRDPFPVFYIS